MEHFRNNTKIEESDIILTDENKIGPIYHTEEEKKIKFMDSNENINIKKEQNITNENQILHNEDESFPKNAYHFDSNKENNEINESKKEIKNLSENLPQNNSQIENKINQENNEKNENNESNNDYNENNNQRNDDNIYNQQEQHNFSNEDEYLNCPSPNFYQLQENQMYPHFPHMPIPLYPHNPYQNIPIPIYPPDNFQINQPYYIPPNFPHPLPPLPPHGFMGYSPINVPLPPHGPHFFPHFSPPVMPHFMPHFGPPFGPHFGPHIGMPPHYFDYPNPKDNIEKEDDIGFSSNKGNIELNNNMSNQLYNDNVKGDFNDRFKDNMQYDNYYEQNIDYRPMEFQPFPFNQYQFYENDQRFINNNIIEENNEKNKNLNLSEEVKSSEDLNNSKIKYKDIPLYIDIILPKLLIDPYQKCFPIKKSKKETKSFPIILFHNLEYYELFIDFLNKNMVYKDFNILPILKTKLIRPKFEVSQIFRESHFPTNFNIIKFADITSSNQFPIYSKEEQENIINEIKKEMNNNDNFFDNFMNNWLNKVMNLMIEFVKFKLKYFSYYYYCDICNFPVLYISDYVIEQFNFDESKNILMISDNINAFNDLMEIINIPEYNSEGSKIRENIINVICYEEEYNYINYSFETEINGIFLNCNSLQSLNKIMDEINDRNIIIQNKNSKNKSKITYNFINNYMFDLIISSIYVDKVFQFFINNNYFKFIKGICVLIDNKNNNINNNLLAIKKKYYDYLKDINVIQNDVFEFFKIEKDNIKYRNNKKYEIKNPLLTYINYNQKYLNIHKISSYYYNKYPSYSSQIFHDIIYDFLENIDIIKDQNKNKKTLEQNNNNKKGSASKQQKINKIINIFKKIRYHTSMSNKNQNPNININIQKNIEKYEKDLPLFIEDFNYWLITSDNLSIEKICYYIGSLMYNIDSYLYDSNEYIENNNDNNEITLYKEFLGDYIDVLQHENNKYKIITFPYFLTCSTQKVDIPNNDDDKYYIIYIIKYDLNNKENYYQILYDLNDDTKVFQMFTFFRISDIKIKRNPKKALIYLEPINKRECLEQKLKFEDLVIYDNDLNIMDTISYYTNNNLDENFESINSDNLYITADNYAYNKNYEENEDSKITRYMQFFNNKYGTNLNPDMTSLSLEEIYMKNDGLLILSKTNLENLVVLNLSKNNISDISPLGKCNCPKLKKLSLESDSMANPQDKITDISPLIHSNFPELFILNLKHNLISDISYLLFMNFPNLIILDLSHNQIESVHVFNEVNFPNLETLDLSYNLISDITPFISSGKRKQTMKSIDNSSIVNSSNITNFLSKSVSSSEVIKKNMALPSLKILKLKNNKINIDEAYLMTVKSLRNRGITIFK